MAIQDAMGWLDDHLHAFRLRNPDTDTIEEIGIPDDAPFEDDRPCLPGWEVPIAAYFRNPGDRSDYTYDFGDGWEHDLLLEGIVARQPRKKYPRCLDGARACPPEDCGGIRGYEDLIQILFDPSHEEYEGTLQWLGGRYDPDLIPRRCASTTPRNGGRGPLRADDRSGIVPDHGREGNGRSKMTRKKIPYGESVLVRLTLREQALIPEHLFCSDPAILDRLKLALVEGASIIVRLALSDLDLLLSDIAAEANHTKSRKLCRELDTLYDRIERVMNSYEEIEPL